MDLNDPATMKSISKIMAQPSVSQPLKNLYRGEPMALGITQIGIGIMEILFGLVILMTETGHSYEEAIAHIRTPYWTGIPYIISGSLSVVVAKKPEVPLVKGMLGMNIVSALTAGIAIAAFSISLVLTPYYVKCNGNGYTACHSNELIYMARVLVMFNVLEFLITIVSAAFGCASLCRSAYSEKTIVVFQNTEQGTPPAVLAPVKGYEVL
ncbi:membrane-spanning 4-domains subfamily A member 15-like [Heteronotia binoei]|uniref:membrane-spanning 4-domains subfamily A member 15-like n=1 Tax=Heteronotia binoei TaxID=13085 RepID=UPI002930187D|nr:membrane-spanning 4-domains subfamily A member 15-like [Heteronotia binoei]